MQLILVSLLDGEDSTQRYPAKGCEGLYLGTLVMGLPHYVDLGKTLFRV